LAEEREKREKKYNCSIEIKPAAVVTINSLTRDKQVQPMER
jgi:hypothetical protein